MEEAQGPISERRITHPRIQASELEETTIKKKEEIQEQSDEKEGTTKSGQSSSSRPRREVIRDKKKTRTSLIEILHKHADAFAWTPTDMTGIPCFIAEHELKTYPHIEPRSQRKRSIAPDRRKVVKEEVAEWLKAGIVKRVRYASWVANPVLVKKPDNSWRMCIDFKDLNKACPKDLYQFPKIDWKIESLMGFKYKCFLDAYKGYHQIQMAKKDEEKIAFHTNEGVFIYTKMTFGLKNTGATYQRLVDTIFEGQIGRNLEACVDDMLNKKCSFGMEEGKFLGYIVTSEGIIANSEKTKAVMNMPSPSSLKQMQRLSELQMLTAPMEDEELMVYLSATNEAVSIVLLVERNERQILIHYVSRALQGAEINYHPMEKLSLALVHAVGRLRRTTEDQAPTAPPDETNLWKLYTDGASNDHGSETCLILIDPEGTEYSYAIRLNFTNSNNDAEYEALLAGLRIAAKMKVEKIHAFVDSKLVANQRLGIKLFTTSVDHPQANGVVEWANRSIMQGIKTTLHQKGGAWVEELLNVLWAHRTTPKTSNGEMLFYLAYGTKEVIPAKIGMPTRRIIQGLDEENKEALRLNLNLLEK
ncbi:reverse transcriptase domain-containing protein [Tanacetum coccineum]